jgi:hypothetical protein
MPPRTPTMPTTPGGTQTTQPKPKQRLIRMSVGGMQNFWFNKLATSDHAKCGATEWYAKEKNKTGGLLSLQIEVKAKKEFDGVGPHTITIWCYVNDDRGHN